MSLAVATQCYLTPQATELKLQPPRRLGRLPWAAAAPHRRRRRLAQRAAAPRPRCTVSSSGRRGGGARCRELDGRGALSTRRGAALAAAGRRVGAEKAVARFDHEQVSASGSTIAEMAAPTTAPIAAAAVVVAAAPPAELAGRVGAGGSHAPRVVGADERDGVVVARSDVRDGGVRPAARSRRGTAASGGGGRRLRHRRGRPRRRPMAPESARFAERGGERAPPAVTCVTRSGTSDGNGSVASSASAIGDGRSAELATPVAPRQHHALVGQLLQRVRMAAATGITSFFAVSGSRPRRADRRAPTSPGFEGCGAPAVRRPLAARGPGVVRAARGRGRLHGL